ncbi:cold-responsive protein kinase 1-like [Euphorbia lathyris]|uniref:cold-responsive protein kinase 1-like n=1 Tax=Euphorbia lathyris TaxID=212925 RepID=UPI003313F049
MMEMENKSLFHRLKRRSFITSIKFSCFSSSSSKISSEYSIEKGDKCDVQNIHAYSYRELEVATNGFSSSNKIGEGGFGCVYKGRSEDGKYIAVKVLSEKSKQGEREFVSEIASLSSINHKNLVKLHGACIHGPIRILVYEFMGNGNLAQFLLGNSLFLSTYTLPFLRKGYLAPEYAISGHLTRKSDIYSFGVVVLEIISGRTAIDFDLQLGEHYLVQKAWEMYKAKKVVELVDSILNGNFNEEEALTFLKVALLCVQEKIGLRPNLSKAIKMMRNEIDITNLQITKPALITDFMNLKIPHTTNTLQTIP